MTKTEQLLMQELHGEFGEKEIENPKLHIACGSYSYIETELKGITKLNELLRLAEALQRRDEGLKFNCSHLFYDELISKKGKSYKKCFSCGRYNFGAEWVALNNKEGEK